MAPGGSLVNILQIGMPQSRGELAINSTNGKKEEAEAISRGEGGQGTRPRTHRRTPTRAGRTGSEEESQSVGEVQTDVGAIAKED